MSKLPSPKLSHPYHICVIDIGSPRLGNIGWCVINIETKKVSNGANLDDVLPIIIDLIQRKGLILGLEAPLFVPLRDDLMLATKARRGEGRRPWSAGAGAQVLTMNLPLMNYIFRKLKSHCPSLDMFVNEDGFVGKPSQIMVFEALVSGIDKGDSHMDDARIMAEYCLPFSQEKILPPSILENEEGIDFLNLTAAALLHAGFEGHQHTLHHASPIYKPSTKIL